MFEGCINVTISSRSCWSVHIVLLWRSQDILRISSSKFFFAISMSFIEIFFLSSSSVYQYIIYALTYNILIISQEIEIAYVNSGIDFNTFPADFYCSARYIDIPGGTTTIEVILQLESKKKSVNACQWEIKNFKQHWIISFVLVSRTILIYFDTMEKRQSSIVTVLSNNRRERSAQARSGQDVHFKSNNSSCV